MYHSTNSRYLPDSSRLFPRLPDDSELVDDPLLQRLQSDSGDDAMEEHPFPIESPNVAPNVGLTSSQKAKSMKFTVDEESISGAAVLDMRGMLALKSVDISADRKSYTFEACADRKSHTFEAFVISRSANVDSSSSFGDAIKLKLHAGTRIRRRCSIDVKDSFEFWRRYYLEIITYWAACRYQPQATGGNSNSLLHQHHRNAKIPLRLLHVCIA